MQDIECLHFSKDGNCRAVYLLLNKELMKHNVDPVILFNPNCFYCSEPNDLVKEVLAGQKAFENFVKTGTPYEECISEEQIKSNIAKLHDERLKVHGDSEELEFVRSLDFTVKTLKILKTIQAKYQFDNLQEFWNNGVRLILIIYEYQLLTEQKPISSIEEFSLACVTKINFFKTLVNKCNNHEEEKDSMPQLTSYLELIEYQNIQEYILKKNDLKGRTITMDGDLKYIEAYLEKLLELSYKYDSGYTIEGLSDPMTCHLSEAESLQYYMSNMSNMPHMSHHFDQVHDKLLSMPYPSDFDITGKLSNSNDNATHEI